MKDTRQEDAHINSFAVLGEGSKENEAEIDALTEEIGEEKGDESTGLYKVVHTEESSRGVQLEESRRQEKEIKRLKQRIANDQSIGIRYKPWCGDPYYTVSKLDADIELVTQKSYVPISDGEVGRLKDIVNDKAREPLMVPSGGKFIYMSRHLDEARPLLSRVVVQQQSIEEFINDSAREAWARSGYELHKDHHETCAFCGQPIPDQRWQALRQCFENEAEDLRQKISNAIRGIDEELKDSFGLWPEVVPSYFYAEFEPKAREIRELLIEHRSEYQSSLLKLKDLLTRRLESIATPIVECLPSDETSKVMAVHKELQDLIVKNNDYANRLREAQREAKEKLRLHEVFVALRDGELRSKIAQHEALKRDIESHSQLIDDLFAKLRAKSARRNELRQLRHDESGAAKLVNTYLSWMGENNALNLVTKEIDEDGVKSKVFRVVRGGKPAYNLSEGECNLIALCYFLAKLSSPELKKNKPIIWIDDPISSLDLNHIYFVYAIIRKVVLVGKLYGQLFISTHNLEFLRYLKRMADWETNAKGVDEVYERSYVRRVRQTS